jgi:hypothetical protein
VPHAARQQPDTPLGEFIPSLYIVAQNPGVEPATGLALGPGTQAALPGLPIARLSTWRLVVCHAGDFAKERAMCTPCMLNGILFLLGILAAFFGLLQNPV